MKTLRHKGTVFVITGLAIIVYLVASFFIGIDRKVQEDRKNIQWYIQ